MMGWLTSFYIDSGVLAADAAQIITSLLWVSLLIGIAANRAGIRWGFATLLIAGVLLVVSAVLNARYFKGRQHSKAVSRA